MECMSIERGGREQEVHVCGAFARLSAPFTSAAALSLRDRLISRAKSYRRAPAAIEGPTRRPRAPTRLATRAPAFPDAPRSCDAD